MTNPSNNINTDNLINSLSNMSISDTDKESSLKLHNAIKNGQLKLITDLIKQMKSSELDVKDLDGKTPLELAIEKNMSAGIIGSLIQKDVDITFLDHDQVVKLLSKIRTGEQFQSAQIRLIRYGVVWCGLDVNKYCSHAITNNLIDLAEELIHQGADINAPLSFLGDTMLHQIVKKDFDKFKSLFYLLLEKKANINAIDRMKSTPLSSALKFDSTGTKRFAFCLIAAGADISCVNREAATELFITILENQDLDNNKYQVLFKLLEHGINVNARLKQTERPLFSSIFFAWDKLSSNNSNLYKGQLEKLAFALLDKGANINLVDNKNRSALFWAIKNKLPEIAIELISRGADVNLASKSVDDDDCASPLHFALHTDSWPIFEKLLTVKGIKINVCDFDGQTPLHIACRALNLEAIHLLLKHGAHLGVRDTRSYTPLVAYLHTSDEISISPELRIQRNDILLDLCTRAKIPAVVEYMKNQDPSKNLLIYFLQNPQLLLTSENPLELALLFGDIPLATAVMSIVPKEAFYAYLEQLTLKYPHQSRFIESFAFAPYTIPVTHFNGYIDISIETRPDNADFSKDLIDIFERLNFRDPEQSHYIDPKTVFEDKNEDETFWTLDAALTECLIYITDSRAYLGTPKADTPALHAFYETIRNAIYFTGKKLKELPWEEAQHLAQTWVLKIFETSKLCGGRLYNTAVSQHATIVAGRKESYENYITDVLGQLRTIALDNTISQFIIKKIIYNELALKNTVHFYNQLMRSFGEKYQIPGYKTFLTFQDPFNYLNEKQIEQAEQFFLTAYSNPEALFYWIRDDIWNNETVRSLFVTYLKKDIPSDFQSNKYDALIDTIRNWTYDISVLEIPYNSLTPQYKFKIDELFGKEENGIIMAKTETPLEAITKDRAAEYIYTIYETVQDGIKTVSRIKKFIILESLIAQKICCSPEKPILQKEEKKEREEKSHVSR